MVLATDLRTVLFKFRRKLREQSGSNDLGWPHVSVLCQLERDGAATVTSLARAEGMRPQSMGATVATLEQAGFVRDEPDPADGRQRLWSLTETGGEWLREHRSVRDDWLRSVIQTRLAPDEQRKLGEALVLLSRLVEP
jgi:DNA-binding MarR family transcriptional regulator